MTNPVNRSFPSQPSHEQPASSFTEAVEQVGSTIAEKAEEAWDATRLEAQHLASKVSSSAESAWDEVNRFVGRHPMLIFVGGVAVGFLVREAMRSSSSDMTRRMSRYSA